MTASFLGSGWKFPVVIDPASGSFAVSQAEEDIREAIRIILFTAKGERAMRPDFGCGIHEYVFETMSVATVGLMETSVREALTRWEPRIDVSDVTVDQEKGTAGSGRLLVHIRYRVRSTNNEFNLVYPFYLKEG